MAENEKPIIEFETDQNTVWSTVRRNAPTVASITTIIGVIITLITYLQPDTRELKAVLVSNAQIINISDTISKDKFSIFYQEQKVEGLNYLKFQFTNNGEKAIKKEDIVQALKINVGKTRKIIDYKYSGKPAVEIIKNSDNELLLNFDLLNSGQSFNLDLFVIGNNGVAEEKIPFNEITIDAAITDMKTIDFQNQVDDRSDTNKLAISKLKSYGIGALFLILLIVFIAAIAAITQENKQRKLQPGIKRNKKAYFTAIILALSLAYMAYIILLTFSEFLAIY